MLSKTVKLLLVVLTIVAFFILPTLAQDETTPPEPTDKTHDDWALIHMTMRIPEGYDVVKWGKAMAKLSPACGEKFNVDALIKDGSGDRNFFIPILLPSDETFTSFNTTCREAFDKNANDLKLYGKVKLNDITEQQYLIACQTTCGIEDCPVCPLLSTCVDEATCGPHTECVESTRDPTTKWCLSSNSSIYSTFIAIVIVGTMLLF